MARKLLLADDSITIQKVVELVLAEGGFEIRAVNNGEEALTTIATFKPDIVLADIEMPKINGYQLCEKLKTNPETKDIPVILLSGAFEPLDEELARQVKAESFVVKPFESQELISKINAYLRAPVEEEAVVPAEVEEEAVVAEAVGVEEDLWAMEEVAAEAVGMEEMPAEAVAEEVALSEGLLEAAELEEVSLAEVFGTAEAEEVEALDTKVKPEAVVEEKIIPPVVDKRVTAVPIEEALKIPALPLLSKEELSSMFRKAVDERIASFLSSIDIKNVLLSSIAPALKDSVEKILWEVTPELTEKLLREMLQGSLASLSKEVEKVIWETVPEIAEKMIAKEIEKIKSEI